MGGEKNLELIDIYQVLCNCIHQKYGKTNRKKIGKIHSYWSNNKHLTKIYDSKVCLKKTPIGKTRRCFKEHRNGGVKTGRKENSWIHGDNIKTHQQTIEYNQQKKWTTINHKQ